MAFTIQLFRNLFNDFYAKDTSKYGYEMKKAFGKRPVRAILDVDLICVFKNEEQVRNMNPNQEVLKSIDGRIQNATARGTETGCVSRSFCLKLSFPEEQVCGSAHCQIADYWAKELGKSEIYAYRASARSGYLMCKCVKLWETRE